MHKLTLWLIILCLNLLAKDYDEMLFSNDYAEVRKGIALGGNIESRLRGSTPIYDAARKYNFDIMYLLLERGADVNSISHGETPLLKVVAADSLKYAKILIKKGARVNVADLHLGNTPLHYAVKNKNKSMIALLVGYGADLYVKNLKGDMPTKGMLESTPLPRFSAKNSDISIDIAPFIIINGNASVNITNLTRKEIDIKSVALYINGNRVGEANASAKIMPNASSSAASITMPSEAYQSIRIDKLGKADIKYGVEVNYEIGGRSNSIHKKMGASVYLW